jgi:peptide/nickel transport system substrate-binding protein
LEPSLRGVQAEKIDDYTFRLILSQPFSPFLSTLTFGILPKHVWFDIYKMSPQNVFLTEYNLEPIGSGPYMFSSLVKNKAGNIKSYQFTPYPNYYGSKPYLKEINIIFYSDVYTAADDLARKDIDGLFAVPRDMKNSLVKKNNDLNIYNMKLPQYTALFFNQDLSKKVLAKDEVREALVWGVDRQKIINDVLNGEAQAVYTPILPGYIGHNADVEKYGLDIEKGKQILEDTGWKIKDDGNPYRQKDGQVLEFTIYTVDQPEYTQVIDILKQNWEQMGFKINISLFSAEDIQEQVIKDRKYEALLFGEITGSDPDPYAFWHSSQQEHPGLALAIFYQKEIDKLLEDGRKTINEEERRLAYFHFQNVLAEEIPTVFLYSPTYIYAVSHKVQGISAKDVPLPSARFLDIVNWYTKTTRIRK